MKSGEAADLQDSLSIFLPGGIAGGIFNGLGVEYRVMQEMSEDNVLAAETVQENPRLGQVLITKTQIAERVKELADQIIQCYGREEDLELIIVAIMTGSLVFLSDLVRAMPLPVRIGIIMVSNYPGTATQAQGVKVLYDLQDDIHGKHVLVVDDILDTGQTLSAVVQLLLDRGARSVRSCVLLDKILPVTKKIAPDFVGFQIPNKFIVGYGLDYDNLFRNYPQIAVLEKS